MPSEPRDLAARLAELMPREGQRQLVAVLEDYRRRGERPDGEDRIPPEVVVKVILDRKGRVVEVEVPRRFGW